MFRTSKRNKLSINDPNHRLEKTPNIRTVDEVLELINNKNTNFSNNNINNYSNSYKLEIKNNSNHEKILIEDSPQFIPNNSNHKRGQKSKKSLSFSPKLSEKCYSQKLTENYEKSYENYNKNECVNNSPKLSVKKSIKGSKRVFQVIWGKHKPYKKHKEWNGDGFLTINHNNSVNLYNISGKCMGSSKGLKQNEVYEEGKRLIIGGNEVEITEEVSVEEYETGMFFVESD